MACVPVTMGYYKTGKFAGGAKIVAHYTCAECGNNFRDKDVEVDHKVQAGSLKGPEDLSGFVTRLFCHADELQVVCKPCHKIKTAEERKKI